MAFQRYPGLRNARLGVVRFLARESAAVCVCACLRGLNIKSHRTSPRDAAPARRAARRCDRSSVPLDGDACPRFLSPAITSIYNGTA